MGLLKSIVETFAGGGKKEEAGEVGKLDVMVNGGKVAGKGDLDAMIPAIKKAAILGLNIAEATQMELILEKVATMVDKHDLFLPEFNFRKGDINIGIIPRRVPTEGADNVERAQRGYQGYFAFTSGKTFDGREMPKWEALPENIKSAWRMAIKAAMD